MLCCWQHSLSAGFVVKTSLGRSDSDEMARQEVACPDREHPAGINSASLALCIVSQSHAGRLLHCRYADGIDCLEWLIYIGSGGRDLKTGNKRTSKVGHPRHAPNAMLSAQEQGLPQSGVAHSSS